MALFRHVFGNMAFIVALHFGQRCLLLGFIPYKKNWSSEFNLNSIAAIDSVATDQHQN